MHESSRPVDQVSFKFDHLLRPKFILRESNLSADTLCSRMRYPSLRRVHLWLPSWFQTLRLSSVQHLTIDLHSDTQKFGPLGLLKHIQTSNIGESLVSLEIKAPDAPFRFYDNDYDNHTFTPQSIPFTRLDSLVLKLPISWILPFLRSASFTKLESLALHFMTLENDHDLDTLMNDGSPFISFASVMRLSIRYNFAADMLRFMDLLLLSRVEELSLGVNFDEPSLDANSLPRSNTLALIQPSALVLAMELRLHVRILENMHLHQVSSLTITHVGLRNSHSDPGKASAQSQLPLPNLQTIKFPWTTPIALEHFLSSLRLEGRVHIEAHLNVVSYLDTEDLLGMSFSAIHSLLLRTSYRNVSSLSFLSHMFPRLGGITIVFSDFPPVSGLKADLMSTKLCDTLLGEGGVVLFPWVNSLAILFTMVGPESADQDVEDAKKRIECFLEKRSKMASTQLELREFDFFPTDPNIADGRELGWTLKFVAAVVDSG